MTVANQDEREVREGELNCGNCAQRYTISEGIVDLLYDPPDFVRREAAGLERFAEAMRNDGWNRERILSLPDVDLGYWYSQAVAIKSLLESVDWKQEGRLLDVGSNTCWASNIFAKRGLEVIALDITKTEMQGLRTAEYFFADGEVFFERVQSVMFDMPLATSSLDYVFCCEVLHHNDKQNLQRTMEEAYRVLRPGGLLLVINEPLRFPLNLKRDHAQEVTEYEGYEHVYFFHEYYLAARRAGFQIALKEPTADPLFRPWTATIGPEMTLREAIRTVGSMTVRRARTTRSLMWAYKTLVAGDVSLQMVASKPR